MNQYGCKKNITSHHRIDYLRAITRVHANTVDTPTTSKSVSHLTTIRRVMSTSTGQQVNTQSVNKIKTARKHATCDITL